MTTETNIGAAARLPDPGPCTDKAHHWNAGNIHCNCGEAARTGDCAGWKVAGRSPDELTTEALISAARVMADRQDVDIYIPARDQLRRLADRLVAMQKQLANVNVSLAHALRERLRLEQELDEVRP